MPSSQPASPVYVTGGVELPFELIERTVRYLEAREDRVLDYLEAQKDKNPLFRPEPLGAYATETFTVARALRTSIHTARLILELLMRSGVIILVRFEKSAERPKNFYLTVTFADAYRRFFGPELAPGGTRAGVARAS